MKRPITAAILCFFALATRPAALNGHSMYQSAVLLDLRDDAVDAELQLPLDRLAISFGKTVDQSSLPGLKASLATYVKLHLNPVSETGRAFSTRIGAMSIETVEGAPYLVVHVAMTPPPGERSVRFTLNYDVISHEIVTHLVLVSIRSDAQRPLPAGPVLIGFVRGSARSVQVDRARRP